MEASYLLSTQEALEYFQVTEQNGLSDLSVQKAAAKYGRNGTGPLENLNSAEKY